VIFLLLGYAATVVVLGSYWLSTRTHRPELFHWGNAIGFVPLGLSEAVVGAWPAFLVTIVFGVLGIWGLWRERQA
jgi:hypothetical protein